VNEAAATAPGTLHRDPYGAGWLFRVEPKGLARSLKKLVSGERGRLFLAEAAERLQQAFHPGAPVLAQDGGTPVHGIARDLDRSTGKTWSGRASRSARERSTP